MDPASMIVMALVSGIVAGVEGVAQQAVRDGYERLKELIQRRYGIGSIKQLEEAPLSKARQAVVEEDLRNAGAENDEDLLGLAQELINVIEFAKADPTAEEHEDSLSPDILIENAERQAGSQAVSQIVDKHIAQIIDAREAYPLNNTDLLSTNIVTNRSIPEAMRGEIGGLQKKIRHIIQQVASRIEDRKYKSAEEAIEDMPLAYTDRIKARELVQADKQIHVSFQALKITVGFFTDLNQMIINRIENSPSVQLETNLVLGNAILVYELTDFVISFIEGFAVTGIEQVFTMYEDAKSRISSIRNQQMKLEQQASSDEIEPAVRAQTLRDIETRERSIKFLESEWENYIEEINTLQDGVGTIRKKIPTLDLIRENARTQLELIQVVAMLQILKRNITALESTILTLEKIPLVSLNPNRVRRLLGIA